MGQSVQTHKSLIEYSQ